MNSLLTSSGTQSEKAKRITIPKIYCSAADLQITPYLSFPAFRTNLLLNQLFCGNLVVTDGFLFMSPYVIKDVLLGTDSSIVLEGLKSGFIRPSFRDNVGGSIKRSLHSIQEQGIIGLIEESDYVANLLESNVADSESYRFYHWPKELAGRGFLKEIKKNLGARSPACFI